MADIKDRLLHSIYHVPYSEFRRPWVVFKESFTGDGVTKTFTLDGTILNATFLSGAWIVEDVQITKSVSITKTNGKAIYDSLNVFTRHRIASESVSAAGVVTLNYAPRNEAVFYIYYWYELSNTARLKDYYRDDIVSKFESDEPSIASSVNVNTTDFGDILSVSEDTVQKALDILDDHGHPDTDITIYGTDYTARDGFDAALRNGIGSGLTVTDEGGLNVSWTEGVAFVDGSVFSVNAAGATGLTDNATNYLYVLKNNSTLQISTTEPDTDVVGEFALVAKYNTYDGDIAHSCSFPLMSGGLRFIIWYFLQKIAPAAVVSGCACSIDTDATNPNDFKIGTGEYFLNPFCSKKIENVIYSAGSGHGANNVQAHFHTASAWDTALENGVSFSYWDNGVQKTAVTGNKWYCGWVYVLGDNTILYVYPQTEHAKEADAQEEEIVYPPYHYGYVLPVARFVFRGSATAFAYNAYFADIRPFLGAVGNGASIQNIYQTITGDTGSTMATESDDSLAIEGAAPVSVAVTADKAEVSLPAATNSQDGYATSMQITKLDGIEEGADVTATHETSHADVLVDGDIGVTVAAALGADDNYVTNAEKAALHAAGGDTTLGAQTENLDMNTHKIVGVVDPTADQDVATKKYVDDNAGGVAFATAAALGTL